MASGAPPIVQDVLRSPGQPLDAATRAFMEPRFGHDFSQVRVHADTKAADSARAVNALAYTVGRDIVFGAGQYAPGTSEGKRLLGHELVHTAQQRQGDHGELVQRTITVEDPAAMTPNDLTKTNAQMVQGWIDELCPTGNWAVDSSSGEVSSPDRSTFCGRRPTRGQPHFSTSGTPTSCSCLCQLTAPGSKDIRVHPANAFAVGTTNVDVTAAGEGVTAYPTVGHPEYHVGITGRPSTRATGVGDTAPLGGANPTQTIRSPAWIIFGHELCGHARLQSAAMGPTAWQHAHTPEGDLGAVDIENRIRHEHSTIGDSWGIRRGSFRDATGARHDGSVYRVSSGETLSGIAIRCRLTRAEMLTRIFRWNGDAITTATQNSIRANERLLIDGIFWHEVIGRETMTGIAAMWVVPLASLIRANPQISDPNLIRPGQRLLIPAR